jgi:acetyl esterase/lipase
MLNHLSLNCLKFSRMKLRIFIYTTLAIVLFSCQKSKVDPVEPPVVPPVVITASTLANVAYGTDALQKMDVFLPANRTTTATKVMIVIHGGGWSTGDKSDMTAYVDTLKKRLPDYAFFNVNYRLYNGSTNTFPIQEQDVKTLTDFIYSKRAEYLISDKFVMLGASAGAHLALLQAYKNTTPKIKAVVDLYGPTDMVQMYNNPASIFAPADSIAKIVTGSITGTPTSNATNTALYNSSSPINFVTINSAPTIIFHGGMDVIVRPSQSTALVAQLAQKGVTYRYVSYPNENHAYLGASLDDTFDKTITFLNSNVQ